MISSYEVVPIVQTPEVKPGGTVEIEIYVTGAGRLADRRLELYHSYRDLFKEDVGKVLFIAGEVRPEDAKENLDIEITDEMVHQREGDEDDEFVVVPRLGDIDVSDVSTNMESQIDSASTHIRVPNWMFGNSSEAGFEASGPDLSKPRYRSFSSQLIEMNWGGAPPFQLELNISEDAKPGDYEIPCIFTYETESGITKSSRETAVFHVNDWIERRQPTLKRVVVGVALAGLLIQIYPTLAGWGQVFLQFVLNFVQSVG